MSASALRSASLRARRSASLASRAAAISAFLRAYASIAASCSRSRSTSLSLNACEWVGEWVREGGQSLDTHARLYLRCLGGPLKASMVALSIRVF